MGLFPALYAKLAEAYHVRLRAFLRRFLLVSLEPAVLRGIVDAGTTHGGPVSFPLTITVHPRDAKGFARVVGKLETPPVELSDEHLPDEQEEYSTDETYIYDVATGKRGSLAGKEVYCPPSDSKGQQVMRAFELFVELREFSRTT